jgi:hypothetical protein
LGFITMCGTGTLFGAIPPFGLIVGLLATAFAPGSWLGRGLVIDLGTVLGRGPEVVDPFATRFPFERAGIAPAPRPGGRRFGIAFEFAFRAATLGGFPLGTTFGLIWWIEFAAG